MSLPRLRKVLKEDLQDAPNWIDKLIIPLNSFFETTYNILNKNVSFTNNIACSIRNLTITTLPTYDRNDPETFRPYKFTHNLRTRPQGVLVMNIVERGGNYSPIIEPPFVNWYSEGNTIHIPFIANLKPETVYEVNLLII